MLLIQTFRRPHLGFNGFVKFLSLIYSCGLGFALKMLGV